MVFNAVWTPRGNIVCTTSKNKTVVVMTQSGEVLAETSMTTSNWNVDVSTTDDVIYLVDNKSSVHQSTDGGLTWNHVFSSPDDWRMWQLSD